MERQRDNATSKNTATTGMRDDGAVVCGGDMDAEKARRTQAIGIRDAMLPPADEHKMAGHEKKRRYQERNRTGNHSGGRHQLLEAAVVRPHMPYGRYTTAENSHLELWKVPDHQEGHQGDG